MSGSAKLSARELKEKRDKADFSRLKESFYRVIKHSFETAEKGLSPRREPQRVHPSEAIFFEDLPVPRGCMVVSNYDEANTAFYSAKSIYIPQLGVSGMPVSRGFYDRDSSKDYVCFRFKKGEEAIFYINGDVELKERFVEIK